MSHLRPRVRTGTGNMPGTPDTLGPSKKSADKDEDPYVAKVIKYIPAETIAAYQAMTGFVPEHAMPKVAPWFALFLLVMTPVWILVATKEKNERWAWYQAVVGVVAFLVWLFAIDSPAAHQVVAVDGGVPGYVRSLVLVGASMVFPVIEKILKIKGIKV